MSTFNTAVSRLVDRLQESTHAGNLIFVALYTIIWGLWLLLFDVFQASSLYSWLSNIGDEKFYGIAAIITGIAMATTILRNIFPWTAYGAFLGFLFWGLIGIGYLLGDYRSTGALTALGLSGYSSFVYLNIRLNQNGGR